jgi:hypothetical protein
MFGGNVGVGEDVGGIGLTALSNNNIARAIANRNAADDTVDLCILDSAAAILFSSSISPGTEIDDVKIVDLTGGNVVIVRQKLTSGTVNAAVFSSTAAGVVNPFQVTGVNRNEPCVAALTDGSLVIVYDDNQNGAIRGQRYDGPTGTAIGAEFIISTLVPGHLDPRRRLPFRDFRQAQLDQ